MQVEFCFLSGTMILLIGDNKRILTTDQLLLSLRPGYRGIRTKSIF